MLAMTAGTECIESHTASACAARRASHHLLAHLCLPALNLTQIKQDTISVPVVLVSINLLVASVAEEDAA